MTRSHASDQIAKRGNALIRGDDVCGDYNLPRRNVIRIFWALLNLHLKRGFLHLGSAGVCVALRVKQHQKIDVSRYGQIIATHAHGPQDVSILVAWKNQGIAMHLGLSPREGLNNSTSPGDNSATQRG